MLRTGGLDPNLKWLRIGGERGQRVPVLDAYALSKAGIEDDPSRRVIYDGTLVLWKCNFDPRLLALVARINAIKGMSAGPNLAAVCDEGESLCLLWVEGRYSGYCDGDLIQQDGREWLIKYSRNLCLYEQEFWLRMEEAPRPPDNPGHIYVLRAEIEHPLYKIGRTRNLPSRMNVLAGQVPFPVTLLHAISTRWAKEAEADFHEFLGKHRVHGEWFDLPEIGVNYLLSCEEWEYSPTLGGL